jgi:hypothetical protein
MGVSRGYKGYKGMEAVRRFLSDIFDKAIGSLDINKRDLDGGKKDSWAKCFGIPIADPTVSKVKLNERGSVSNEKALDCDRRFPTNFVPRSNNIVADGFRMPENYVLSFTIRPRGIRGGWSNIFRFGQNSGDCCGFGPRACAIWFFPGNTRLHIRIGVQTDGNWGIDTDNLPLNQESKVRIECVGNQVTVTVNERTYTGTQPSKRVTEQVTLFTSDRFYEAANCEVRNFCFTPL